MPSLSTDAPPPAPPIPNTGGSPIAVADELLTQTTRIRRAARRRGRRPAELSQLTGSQLELVRLLRRRPGVSVADAAAELALAPNTVSTLVRQCAEAGLIVRRVDADDRRVARLELSPHISDTVHAWRDRRMLAVGEAIGALSEAERLRLAQALPLLARVADQLESTGPER